MPQSRGNKAILQGKGVIAGEDYKYSKRTCSYALPVSPKLTGVDESEKANLKRKEKEG